MGRRCGGIASRRWFIEQNASRRRFLKAGHDAQQRGLAGAALAQQGKKLTPLYVERNGFQHGVLAKAFANVLQAEKDTAGGHILLLASHRRAAHAAPPARREGFIGWPLLRSKSRCTSRAAAHPARRQAGAGRHRYRPGAGCGVAPGSSTRRLAGLPEYIRSRR